LANLREKVKERDRDREESSMDACYKEREVERCVLQRMVCCRELCIVVEVRGPSKKIKKMMGM
jgi:hypothetical protein